MSKRDFAKAKSREAVRVPYSEVTPTKRWVVHARKRGHCKRCFALIIPGDRIVKLPSGWVHGDGRC